MPVRLHGDLRPQMHLGATRSIMFPPAGFNGCLPTRKVEET